MGSLDILFFAVVAAILFVRLWSVLGRQDDEDQDRKNRPTPPNPFARAQIPPDEDVVILPGKTPSPQIEGPPGISAHGYALSSLAGGLDHIKTMDPSFQEKTFLAGAKIAFESILGAFAAQDLEPVAPLLAPPVRASFERAIQDRKDRAEILDSKIIKTTDIDVIAARVDDGMAILTVQIESQQTNVIRSAAGAVLSGDPQKLETVVDKWVFARALGAADPNWQLVATGV